MDLSLAVVLCAGVPVSQPTDRAIGPTTLQIVEHLRSCSCSCNSISKDDSSTNHTTQPAGGGFSSHTMTAEVIFSTGPQRASCNDETCSEAQCRQWFSYASHLHADTYDDNRGASCTAWCTSGSTGDSCVDASSVVVTSIHATDGRCIVRNGTLMTYEYCERLGCLCRRLDPPSC